MSIVLSAAEEALAAMGSPGAPRVYAAADRGILLQWSHASSFGHLLLPNRRYIFSIGGGQHKAQAERLLDLLEAPTIVCQSVV